MMELRNHVVLAAEALKVDVPSAFAKMSEDIEALVAESMTKEYKKELRKRAEQDKQLAPHYDGVAPSIAKWGKEAHSLGLHAHGMERAGKAPKDKIVDAHSEAQKAHHFAAEKLRAAGHTKQADLHKQASMYHGSRVRALDPSDMAAEAVGDDLRAASTHAHMAQWRASRLKAKLADKKTAPKPQLKYSAVVRKTKQEDTATMGALAKLTKTRGPTDLPNASRKKAATAALDKLKKKYGESVSSNQALAALAKRRGPVDLPNVDRKKAAKTALDKLKSKYGESIEEAFNLDESYPEAVKSASMNAGKATKAAQGQNPTADQHATAASLHFIAHGVAKAHGHDDLAAKHLDFMTKHKEAAKALKTAKSA